MEGKAPDSPGVHRRLKDSAHKPSLAPTLLPPPPKKKNMCGVLSLALHLRQSRPGGMQNRAGWEELENFVQQVVRRGRWAWVAQGSGWHGWVGVPSVVVFAGMAAWEWMGSQTSKGCPPLLMHSVI